MVEWISFIEAVARIEITLKVSKPAPLLRSAIDEGSVEARGERTVEGPKFAKPVAWHDAVNRYAGGLTYVDLEADQKIAAAMDDVPEEVNLESLIAWMHDLKGVTPPLATKAKVPHRPPEKLEAVKAALRTLPQNSLTGKREALLWEVGQMIAPMTVSKKTLNRALSEIGQK
ncbi:hypothetical protein [Mesorhizobium sp. Cs1321R2N1]|uniref:hypothetical protein n=1 Tax=Mesorhizobium sp. Cs1321R2N1 TaxID=3015174 RepID=UPI00301BAB32